MSLLIGVDPGVKTGFAVWDGKKITETNTISITQAMRRILELDNNYNITLIIEDARLRKWFGNNAKAKQQGAGSIKRDCKIWEDFCNENKIKHELIHPIKGSTKINAETFKRITKFEGRTSEHSRDAALLVFGKKTIKNTWK